MSPRLVSAVVTLLALGSAVTSAAPGRSADREPISWADKQHRHGWAAVAPGEAGRWCPTRYRTPRLCATEDGGKTWRGVLYVDGFERIVFDRTSRRAGLVSLVTESGLTPLWTRDNGLHWYGTSIFINGWPGPARLWGTGERVFWRSQRGAVYRVVGWPPRGKATCPARWVSGIRVAGPRRNICWNRKAQRAPPVDAGMKSESLSRPPPPTSWADTSHRHGWAVEPHSGKALCAARRYLPEIHRYKLSAICATENGGKTWRPILYTQRSRISSLIRTSTKAGIVVSGYWNSEEYWTRDGGKHWYQTDVLRPPGYPFNPTFTQLEDGLYFRAFSGNGARGSEVHSAFFRLSGWVPKGPLGCKPRQLCNAGMQAVRVEITRAP